jgi:hypothetical protein
MDTREWRLETVVKFFCLQPQIAQVVASPKRQFYCDIED